MTGFVTAGEGSENVVVPGTHDAIDHTGAPLNLLDETAHDVLDHTGLTGVPAAEAFTSGVHSVTNHTGIAGVGDLSTAAHAILNHTGIPGVGTGIMVQQVRANNSSLLALPSGFPDDNTIPQISEGTEVVTVAITPTSLSNILLVEFTGSGGGPIAGAAVTALFRDSIANALAVTRMVSNNGGCLLQLRWYLTVPTLSSQTYRIRCGWNNGAATLNAPGFGGTARSVLTVTELTP